MSAPVDPGFYADLLAMARRVGARPEDLLYVWSSETALRTDLSGPSRTFSALMHPYAVPHVMSEGTWQELPSMSAREQLPYVEHAIYAPAHRKLGRPFRSTFEVYLANAAPGLLRPDGAYCRDTVMYMGAVYPHNWVMDTRSVSVPAYLRYGGGRSLPESYDVARSLVIDGKLKGYISLGDLADFAKRLLGSHAGNAAVFDCAVYRLDQARAAGAAGAEGGGPLLVSGGYGLANLYAVGAESPAGPAPAPGGSCPPAPYAPDFDSQFVASKPDPTVAIPERARLKTPGVPPPAPKGALATAAEEVKEALSHPLSPEGGAGKITPGPPAKAWWIAAVLGALGLGLAFAAARRSERARASEMT